MNPEYKAAWIAALRSGEYRQTTGTLKRTRHNGNVIDGARHCCLGVLCELDEMRNNGRWQPHPTYPRARYHVFDVLEDTWGDDDHRLTADDSLPQAMRDRLDISSSQLGRLIAKNDQGETFAAIADWIEANL